MNRYHLDDNEQGKQTIYKNDEPMTEVQIVCELSDLYHKQQKLQQRLRNLRDKTIRFAEKEMKE